MPYPIGALAKLAGISSRTLRYYDRIGLLRPAETTPAGYRIYSQAEVDRLQQILLYKGFGFQLDEIASILDAPDFDRAAALGEHLERLQRERRRMDLLIHNIKQSIDCEEGRIPMKDADKFEGLKRDLVAENERSYGEEVRREYGEEAVEKSNAKFLNLTGEQYDAMQQLASEILTKLEDAVVRGADAAGQDGKEIAELHRRWLEYTWDSYSREAHRNLGEMYVADERFTAYYDSNVAGCAKFLRDALVYNL